MASCKDCVHVEVCRFKDLPAPLSDSYIRESECIEKRCGDFKDRSRFVELPCLPGDKVFYFGTDERIYVQTVNSLIYGVTKTGFVINSEVDFISDLLGKRIFLGYEEAEQALKVKSSAPPVACQLMSLILRTIASTADRLLIGVD